MAQLPRLRLVSFQRERFLLRAIAGLFAVQFLIFLIGLAACIEQSRRSTGPVCSNYGEHLQRSFETALATSLALLGGSRLSSDR